MSTFADVPAQGGNWLTKTERWLDARGKGAWIAAMVAGFILFWPIGLVLLAYMMFQGKFSGGGCSTRRKATFRASKSSGNAAFDSYRNETLRRLEEEQEAFEAFLKRLREAKDKAEFDQFMDDRAKKRDADLPEPQDA